MKVFRSHDTVPDHIDSPTLRALAEEWVAINANADHHYEIAQLGLPGCTRPCDVLDLNDALSSGEEANRILYKLVTSQSYLCWRIALQAVLPRILLLAMSRNAISGGLEDHLQDLIGGVWEEIGSYNPNNKNYVALNITRRRPTKPDHLVLRENVDDHAVAPETELAASELRLLFRDGLRMGAVTEDDVELLTEIYIEGYSTRQAADRRNATPVAIRKRCERTRTRLATVGA